MDIHHPVRTEKRVPRGHPAAQAQPKIALGNTANYGKELPVFAVPGFDAAYAAVVGGYPATSGASARTADSWFINEEG